MTYNVFGGTLNPAQPNPTNELTNLQTRHVTMSRSGGKIVYLF